MKKDFIISKGMMITAAITIPALMITGIGGVWYVMGQKIKDLSADVTRYKTLSEIQPDPAPTVTPIPEPTNKPTPTPTKRPAPTARNVFNLDSLKEGDGVADMSVVRIMPYSGGEGKELSETNAKIQFYGETTITGTYTNEDSAFGGPTLSFSDLDAASLAKMPQMNGEDQKIWFVFDNAITAESLFGPIGSKGKATIVINNYTINNFPAEVINTATLVKVTNKN